MSWKNSERSSGTWASPRRATRWGRTPSTDSPITADVAGDDRHELARPSAAWWSCRHRSGRAARRPRPRRRGGRGGGRRRRRCSRSTGPSISSRRVTTRPPRAGAEIGLDHRGIALHLGRCALGDLAAELDHVDVVADVEHEAHVVVDEEDRHPGVDDPSQPPTEFERLLGVEAGRGLVHAHELRLRGEGPGGRHELALALADLGREAVGEVGDVEDIEGEVDRRPGRAGGSAARSRAGSSTTTAVRRRPRRFSRTSGRRTAPTTATCGRARAGRVDGPTSSEMSSTVEVDAPAGRHESGDAVDERGLPGAVRADEPDELTRDGPRSRRRRRRADRRT